MIAATTRLVEHLAGLGLPDEEREIILADLREEAGNAPASSPRVWVAWHALRIAARYHAECYRDPDDRRRIAMLLVVGLSLLWVVPSATARLFGGADVFTDPVSRALVELWRASHVTSAAAAGLAVGRLPWLAPHVAAARWHVAATLSLASIARFGFSAGALAGILLLAAAWLGTASRPPAHDGSRAR